MLINQDLQETWNMQNVCLSRRHNTIAMHVASSPTLVHFLLFSTALEVGRAHGTLVRGGPDRDTDLCVH